jgi:threonine dehydrogenase-like Zn-dependent dehydrogenase
MQAALELIAGGQIDPRALISHRLPLEETARALELQRTASALKVIVQP